MMLLVRKSVKCIYYFLRLDGLGRLLSVDLYTINERLFGGKLKNEDLYEIGALLKAYKQQVYVVAATEDYIRLFLPSLLKQLILSGSLINTNMIVGVIFDHETSNDVGKVLKKEFPCVDFVTMKSKFTDISSVKNCARFFLTKKILEKSSNSQILITDIDVQLNQQLDVIFAKYRYWNAIKLRRGRGKRFFCYAGCVLLTAKNRQDVISDLCNRITSRFLSRNWYTDQISLWFTYKQFKSSFRGFTEETFSVEFKDASIFAWKGSNKYSFKSPSKVKK